MMSMPEDIKLLLLQRPELKRWFDPITGHYRVPRVKVRSQKSQERALSRLSESATSSLGFSCDDFEVVAEEQNDSAIIEMLASRGQIIQGGMLHTQRRLGKCKGGRDARILHDAIKTSVQEIRIMRTEMHKQGHSISLIEKDEHDTACAIDELKEKTMAMDTSVWQQQTLIDAKRECKFRSDLLNKLVNARRKKYGQAQKLITEADQRASEADVKTHNADGTMHQIDARLADLKGQLEKTKDLGEVRWNYNNVLRHVQQRSHHDLQNAPVRQNFLNSSLQAYSIEVNQAKSMLENCIHQVDAERREIDHLELHVHELEYAQKLKLDNLDHISVQEKHRRARLLTKEAERKEFARELVEMSSAERNNQIHDMLDGKSKSLEDRKNQVTLLYKKNVELIEAFEQVEQATNESDVEVLVQRFLNRDSHLQKMTEEHDVCIHRLKEKQTQEKDVHKALENAKVEYKLVQSHDLKSAKTRKEREKLERSLKPLLRNVQVKRDELEKKISQLKSIVATCQQIVETCGKEGGGNNETTVENKTWTVLDDSTTISSDKKAIKSDKVRARKQYNGRVVAVRKMHDIIASMYEQKARADQIDDNANNNRDSLHAFAKNYFRQQYGTTIAVSKMREFRGSMEIHLGQNQNQNQNQKNQDAKNSTYRMRWFSTMIGWDISPTEHDNDKNDDEELLLTPYHPEAIDAWLQVLQEVLPLDTIEERMDDVSCMVSIEKTLKALGTDGSGMFDMNWRSTRSFKNLVAKLKHDDFTISPKKRANDVNGQVNGQVNLDHMANMVLCEWYRWRVDQTPEEKQVDVNEKIIEKEETEDSRNWLEKLNIDRPNVQPKLTRACQLVRTLVTQLQRGKHDELFGAALYQELEELSSNTMNTTKMNTTNTTRPILTPSIRVSVTASSSRKEAALNLPRPVSSARSVVSFASFPDSGEESEGYEDEEDEEDEEDVEDVEDVEDPFSLNSSIKSKTGRTKIIFNPKEKDQKDQNSSAPKSRGELKQIATLVSSGKARHISKSSRKATMRDSAMKEQEKRELSRGKKKRGGKDNSLMDDDHENHIQTNRRGSLMDQLNRQRVMTQHHELKHMVMDMTKAKQSAKRRQRERRGGAPNHLLGLSGLRVPKAPLSRKKKDLGGSSSSGRSGSATRTRTSKSSSKRGQTPRTKFMKVAKLKRTYG